jgi:hypothetical protein
VDDNGAAEHICSGRGQAQQKAEENGMHLPEDDTSSRLSRMPDVHHVPILDDVVLAFEA